MSLEIGSAAPNFSSPAHDGRQIDLASLAGRKAIIYFYPKDDTPGCTIEGREFAGLYPQFQAVDTEILGVSRDSIRSHCSFAEKYGFPFPLLSDEDESLCKAFDVIKEKNMYGKLVMGIERSTFLIGRDGKLVYTERKVKAEGHAAQMLELARNTS